MRREEFAPVGIAHEPSHLLGDAVSDDAIFARVLDLHRSRERKPFVERSYGAIPRETDRSRSGRHAAVFVREFLHYRSGVGFFGIDEELHEEKLSVVESEDPFFDNVVFARRRVLEFRVIAEYFGGRGLFRDPVFGFHRIGVGAPFDPVVTVKRRLLGRSVGERRGRKNDGY